MTGRAISSDAWKCPFSASPRARPNRASGSSDRAPGPGGTIRPPAPAVPGRCALPPASGSRRSGGAPGEWLPGAGGRSHRAAPVEIGWRRARNERRRASPGSTARAVRCASASSRRPCCTRCAARCNASRLSPAGAGREEGVVWRSAAAEGFGGRDRPGRQERTGQHRGRSRADWCVFPGWCPEQQG